jgi:hypothetical protein
MQVVAERRSRRLSIKTASQKNNKGRHRKNRGGDVTGTMIISGKFARVHSGLTRWRCNFDQSPPFV